MIGGCLTTATSGPAGVILPPGDVTPKNSKRRSLIFLRTAESIHDENDEEYTFFWLNRTVQKVTWAHDVGS